MTYFDQPIFVQRTKTRSPHDLLDRALIMTSATDRFADTVIDHQKFRYRGPPAITGARASFAANRLAAVREINSRPPDKAILSFPCIRSLSLCGLSRLDRELPDQALRHHARDRGRKKISLSPMSIRRAIAAIALLVCSVENTRCRSKLPEWQSVPFRGREFRRS